MRTPRKPFVPFLEVLEDRWVPATIKLVGGSLYISNQVGALTVAVQPTAGQVKITDGLSPAVTVSGVGSLISITGTNNNNLITFKGNTGFNGNLLVRGGNGNDTVVVSGPVGGSVTVNNGLGNDGIVVPAGSSLSVGGNFVMADTSGNNLVNVEAPTTVGGDMVLTGVGGVPVGGLNVTGALTVGGNMQVTGQTTGGTPLLVASVAPLSVGKALTVTGFGGNDTFGLFNTSNIGGDVTVNLGDGGNKVSLFPSPINVGGNLTIKTGSGDDLIQPDTALAVAGNMSIDAGDGANSLVLFSQFTVAGDMSITQGNGDSPLLAFGGLVAGNLNFTIGNGNNAVTMIAGSSVSGTMNVRTGNGNNALTLLAGSSVGGPLSVRTGNGNNTLSLEGAQTYVADVVFGNGNDSLTLNNAAAVLTGLVDGGGRITANTFTQTAGTLSPNLVLANFP